MESREKYIQDFYQLEPWKYQKITRYTWSISHSQEIRRDLILYLGVWTKPFDPLKIKIECYRVDIDAYTAIYFRDKIKIQVRLGERMQYVFEDTFDYTQVLLKCQSFKFEIEEVDYKYL